MPLKTPEEFEESLKNLHPKIFMNGKRIESVFENPNTRTVVESNKASYRWALDPTYAPIMTCYSHLIKEKVNRYTHVSASIEDLVVKAEAGTFTAERLGTCIYRCVGYDALHALAATTWEMDRDLGTKYHPRFLDYVKMVQKQDLSCAGALTEPRGNRQKRAIDWPDEFLSLKIVDQNEEGITVRGAKINISGAFASHELIVLPQSSHTKEEKDYALAFAVPADTEGLTYICQYSPYSAEREQADDIYELGNPLYGQRETSMIVFDNVFVPWERVFHCGEYKYSGKIVHRFGKTHRMTCGGTCKVGFMNQIIGACRMIQEYKGLEKAWHINEQLTEMLTLRETGRACGLAAAREGSEDPPGSGVYLPDDMMGNVSKLNICNAFWRVMALAGDIGGGLIVTMPSLKEFSNPETRDYVKEFYSFGSDEPTENILKVTKLLQHWTAGQHGVGTWHGAGPVMAQKIMIQRLINFEHEKSLVRETLGIKDKGEKNMAFPAIPPKRDPKDFIVSREIDINAPTKVVFEVVEDPELFVELESVVQKVTITSAVKRGKGLKSHWELEDPGTGEGWELDEEVVYYDKPNQIAYVGHSGGRDYSGVHNLSKNPDGSTHLAFNEVFHFEGDPDVYGEVVEGMLENIKKEAERRIAGK